MSLKSMANMPHIIKESSRGYDSVKIEDELLKTREIFLTDTIDADSMDSIIKQLMYLYRDDPDKEIVLYISSTGGNVDCGLAIYDFMKIIDAPIRTVCIGIAASMGAILFLAGDNRVMMPHSRIMIHDPAPGGGSMAGMKPEQIEENLAILKKAQKVVVDIIAETTGKSQSSVRRKTRKDSYFNAEEAVAFGLATEILKSL